MVAGLRLHVLPLGERDVRRVGDHQVHLAVEVREGLQGVSLAQVDPGPLDVLARPPEGVLGQLHGVHTGARDLLREGERDGARSGAQVDDQRFDDVHRADGVYGPADDRLGLRPGHEHTGPHLEFEVAEVGAPGDVLERFTRLAARDDLPVAGVEVHVLDGVQLAPLHAVHEGGEFLRVVARRGHAGVGQPLGGLGDFREQHAAGVRGSTPKMLLHAGPPGLSCCRGLLTRRRAWLPSPRRRRPGSSRRGRRPGPGPSCTP